MDNSSFFVYQPTTMHVTYANQAPFPIPSASFVPIFPEAAIAIPIPMPMEQCNQIFMAPPTDSIVTSIARSIDQLPFLPNPYPPFFCLHGSTSFGNHVNLIPLDPLHAIDEAASSLNASVAASSFPSRSLIAEPERYADPPVGMVRNPRYVPHDLNSIILGNQLPHLRQQNFSCDVSPTFNYTQWSQSCRDLNENRHTSYPDPRVTMIRNFPQNQGAQNQFPTSSNQDEQFRMNQNPSRVYICHICSADFTNPQAFGGHMSSHSKAKIKRAQQLLEENARSNARCSEKLNHGPGFLGKGKGLALCEMEKSNSSTEAIDTTERSYSDDYGEEYEFSDDSTFSLSVSKAGEEEETEVETLPSDSKESEE